MSNAEVLNVEKELIEQDIPYLNYGVPEYSFYNMVVKGHFVVCSITILQLFHSTLPVWISRILSHSALLTGPRPTVGSTRSLPSKPIRPTGATMTAVPTTNTSTSLPSADHEMRSCIVIARSWGWRRCTAGIPGRLAIWDVWAARRARHDARVTPGRMVPSRGGVTTSKSVEKTTGQY
jgi:hypothetical protein